MTHAERRFRFFGLATLISVFLVILAGGIVRMSGSGMGCPDWPRCFGSWIPPTHESQLPADYQVRYDIHGHGVEPFNAMKTWTEYINRLIGALAGVWVFFTMLASISYLPVRNGFLLYFLNGIQKLFSLGLFRTGARYAIVPERRDIKVFLFAFLAFILMGLQGFLGAKVVSSNLAPIMVTVHMLLALVIVFVLVYTVSWPLIPRAHDKFPTATATIALAASLVLTLVQIALGTQVRESIDVIAASLGYTQRDTWIGALGNWFYVHRSFSILLLITGAWVFYLGNRYRSQARFFYVWSLVQAGVMVFVTLCGVGMAYLSIPPLLQPLHLVGAALLVTVQFALLLFLLKSWNSRQVVRTFPLHPPLLDR